MESVDTQVLKKAAEWIRQGHGAVLGTVVRTWGSAPRPLGALVAIRADGQIVGSVSGGCIEDDLIDRIRRMDEYAARTEAVKLPAKPSAPDGA